MEDLEGYREAHAEQWNVRQAGRSSFEVEGLVSGLRSVISSNEHGRLPKYAGGACCVLFLALFSIGSLTPLQYGLIVNTITRHVDADSVYQGGRHFIMPWNSFIVFPSTQVTVTFRDPHGSGSENQDSGGSGYGTLETRTKDGLSLSLELAFQYKIEPDSLGKLFSLANLQYEPLFVRNARDVLLKAAADYEAFEYWSHREKIGNEMKQLLDERLTSLYAHCPGLQVMVIKLPGEFETSIEETQVMQQMQKTRQMDQQMRRIEADTTVLKASFARNVTVTKTGADASYSQALRIAQARAAQRLVEVEASAMEKVKLILNLTSEQMVAYQEFVAYASLHNASFVYGLGNAMLTLPTTM